MQIWPEKEENLEMWHAGQNLCERQENDDLVDRPCMERAFCPK